MGGRRARSITEIVGTGKALSTRTGQLTEALAEGDADAVAESSAKLIGVSNKIDDILYYASKLTKFIERTAKKGEDLSHEERQKLARKEWSRIKRKENLKDDPIATKVIVSAAAKAIGRRKK